LPNKNLALARQAFRAMKSADLAIQPIYRRPDGRIRARLFATIMAYCVEWRLREAWREASFRDLELAAIKKTRDPAEPAKKPDKAKKESSSKMTDTSNTIKAYFLLYYRLI
jgi:hypothetical protein